MSNKERKLKVLPKYFPRRWEDAVFPEIRLAGKWLQDLGFTCGSFVSIAQQENTITITVLQEAETQPPIKKPTRKKDTFMPPDIESLPGDQLFRVWTTEEYHVYVAKIKEEKNRRKKITKERAWDAFKRERLAGLSKSQTPIQPTADKNIIQLHPEPSQAADGCNFDTIA